MFIEITTYTISLEKGTLNTCTIAEIDLAEMEKKLKYYTQNGIGSDLDDSLEEHAISISPKYHLSNL